MNEFLTWETLATFAGASAATGLLTQFLKGTFPKLPTQWLSYIIALVVMGVATAATQWGAGWTVWALLPINAVIVSTSANGAFSAVKRIADGKPGEQEPPEEK